MVCHDSSPQLSHGVPWLTTPVTKLEEVLNQQGPDASLVMCASTRLISTSIQ